MNHRFLLGVAVAALSLTAFAMAQDRPRLQDVLRDLVREALAERDAENADNADAADAARPASAVIDFENVEGEQVGAGIALNTQYEKSHGVAFGRGASVHFCARVTDDVMASLCPYPDAASGKRVAAHDTRIGGNAMVLSLSRPIEAISMRINPTGGRPDEVFTARVIGYVENSEETVTETVRFNWFQDAFTWPTIAGFKTDGARINRVTIELLRELENNRQVRFLIDDLTLVYTPESTATPLGAAILAAGKEDAPVGRPTPIRTADRGEAGPRPVFPPAPKYRLPIDWNAAFAMRDQQAANSIEPVAVENPAALDRAILPVILPRAADGPANLAVQRSGDSFSAIYEVGGTPYEVYGTRAFIDMGTGSAAPVAALSIEPVEYGVVATFSLFGGASYRVLKVCEGATFTACQNDPAFKDHIAEMTVAFGAAAEGRP